MKKFAKVLSMMLVVALAAVMFTGCVLTAEKATEKLKNKGYTVISSADQESSGSALGDLLGGIGQGTAKLMAESLKAENVIIATKKDGDKTETVYLVYFKEKEDAKKLMEKKDEMEKQYGKDKDNDFKIKQSGNAVVFGTKKAVGLVA